MLGVFFSILCFLLNAFSHDLRLSCIIKIRQYLVACTVHLYNDRTMEEF